MSTRLSDYDYQLPEGLIAQTPAQPRDSSRLLVLDRSRGSWEHRIFRDLPDYLDEKDLLVVNNTQVIKARLLGYRLHLEKGKPVPGGKVEFLLLEEKGPLVWEGMFHASVKHKSGVRFEIPTVDGIGIRGEIIQGANQSLHGTVIARFDRDPVASGAGEVPLPHYIKRAALTPDEESYQTIYACEPGSAAAPTAGFHFTEEVRQTLIQKTGGWAEVTLHVGLGTFRPVKAENIEDHQMHEERYEITESTAQQINEHKRQKGKILAVGTTAVRTLESAAASVTGVVSSGPGRTSMFIYPGGYHFRVVDRMLTNFHLPKSTLLMLVSAFAGRELVLAAYQEAVKEKYRFFSYGDAMLIL